MIAKKYYRVKSRITRYLLRAFSFTGIMFVFQACYGTPQDFGLDTRISGKVSSESKSQSIENIRVSLEEYGQYTYTDALGYYALDCPYDDTLKVLFEDIDGNSNGSYISRKEKLVLSNGVGEYELDVFLKED